jgi:hypothetical protein
MILELLYPRIEALDLATERPSLSLGCAQLITENTNLIAEDVDLLLKLGEIDCDGPGAALFAPVDLVKAGGQGDKASYRQNDRKSQSYVPAAHAVDSTLGPGAHHTALWLGAPLNKAHPSSARAGCE